MSRTFLILFLISVCSTLSSQELSLRNVKIAGYSNPNEPSISIHPKKPKLMAVGVNLNRVYISRNGGRKWKGRSMESDFGVWGDPVMHFNSNGRLFYFHLANPKIGNWIDRIVCQYSDDKGKSWTPGSFTGLDGKKAQDKHWVTSDGNKLYLTWTQFDKYGSKEPDHYSNIHFSMSEDGGDSWSPAKRINEVSGDCIDSSNTTEGAVPALGLNGEIYVSWVGPAGLRFDRSTDGGKTWLEEDIEIDPEYLEWNYSIPGIYRCNGMPITLVDRSQGPNRGTIYVCWSDQRNGKDDTDIFMAKSKDGGNSWSAPKRINDDPAGKHQFMCWMTIHPETGDLYTVFYDRRNMEGNETQVYLAYSRDGGERFTNLRISEESFTPNELQFFGDYTNIAVSKNYLRPVWARMDKVATSVWTALIDIRKLP
jgi:hypothetical protein